MLFDNIKTICSICLAPILSDDLCITDCNHEFCKECLDKWFNENKLSCPLCRSTIEYFNYNNINNRIVCIIKNIRDTSPINVQHIIITRKSFLILNSIMGCSIMACLYLSINLIGCEDLYYGVP